MTAKTPKVSIIIPAYNRSNVIKDALDSIMVQSFQGFEVIVVDDCSSDSAKTREIVESFDERFKFYCLEKNLGPAAARNYGFKQSQGEYIAFLDSDDMYRPEKLARQIEILEQNPDAGMVYSDEYTMNSKGEISAFPMRKNKILPHGKIAADFFQSNFIGMMTVMMRREIFEEMQGFDESLIWYEDSDLWLRIMFKYDVLFSDYPAGIRRLHHSTEEKPGNMSINRHKMVYYQFMAISKYIRTEPGFIRDNIDIVQKRINQILKSYIFPGRFRCRVPDIEVLKQYFILKSQVNSLKQVVNK